MEEKPINVLLLEDDPFDQELVKVRLDPQVYSHFTLEYANLLRSALERLEKGGIDVILADLNLPDTDGLDTITALKAKAPNIPIVVLTGSEDQELALLMAKVGVQDYLLKTEVVRSSLARSIQYAVERTRLNEKRKQGNGEQASDPRWPH